VKLFNEQGQRKYLNAAERKAFKNAAEKQPREVRTFCLVLYYTGCRISEALTLTPELNMVSFGLCQSHRFLSIYWTWYMDYAKRSETNRIKGSGDGPV
jgi:hypothetical protein